MSPVHFSVIAHHQGVTLWHCGKEVADMFEFARAEDLFAVDDLITTPQQMQRIVSIRGDRIYLSSANPAEGGMAD